MQYHLNGFRPGDPAVAEPADGVEAASIELGGDAVGPSTDLPDEVDVLIVGCGPAGLTLATQLAAFPSIKTRIVEQNPGPLRLGQADGIACRSMEMFEAFGFAEKVAKEAYWVSETSFWRPDEADPSSIVRADRIQDVEDDLSEFPHTILNQARVHDFFLEAMRNSSRRLEPDYGRRFRHLTIEATDGSEPNPYPVVVTLEKLDPDDDYAGGEIETVRARYVVGCDGARSSVRSTLDLALAGDSANKVWGVMDVLAVTDFPDIRLKCAIQSATEGSALIIPREGGYMVRIYSELGELGENERARDRNITPEQLVAAAQRILAPYTIEVKEVAWWSAYEIGQRLADTFDDVGIAARGKRRPSVFITGDACHTHSPKAGQGMNVSMADSFNLGWKLVSVILGRSSPEILETYSSERQAVAEELIDFDRDMANLFSLRAHTGDEPDGGAAEQAEFQTYFAKHGRYTAGVETTYQASIIVGPSTFQYLAPGLGIGRRFHSAPVVRLGDAKPVHLAHAIKADGRWRLIVFADASNPMDETSPVSELCTFLRHDPESPVSRYTPTAADVDSVIDVRAVFQQHHRDLALQNMPPFLLPTKGRYGLVDYEKMFCPDFKHRQNIFDARDIDRTHGCIVVARPDQTVAHVLPLDAYDELSAFFAGFMIEADRSHRSKLPPC